VADKEEKEAKKVADKEEKEAKKEAEKESKKVDREAKNVADRESKKARTTAVRCCARNLELSEKVKLVEDGYLARLIGENANTDDIDTAVKNAKAVEWQKMVAMNWDDEGGKSYMPDQYRV
jgi:hypothetical protein